MSNEAVYTLTSVRKDFSGPTETVSVLNDINLQINVGESVAVLGASGSGKTTLLHIMGTLDTISAGSAFFCGRNMIELDQKERAKMRNDEIGFVFQFHHLLPEFSAVENVAMPGLISGMASDDVYDRAREALVRVGLKHRLAHKVTTLSGGERQRAAIARAILMQPAVILADEPTGSLDEKTGQMVGELLASLNEELGTTLLVATHNNELACMMQRRLELRSGELYAD